MNAADEQLLMRTCDLVGIGLRSLQSRERFADTVRRRAIVAWLLRGYGWKQAQIAKALHRTVRQVKRLLLSQKR